MNNSFLRWAIRILVPVLVLGIPFVAMGGVSKIGSDPLDAVSAATDVAFDPEDLSGEYVVYINEERHPDTGEVWSDFFRGEEVPVILDDISCLVCNTDPEALEYAKICQARLPANQMKIGTDETIMILSKGDAGKFDIILLSKEVAQQYSAESIGKNEFVRTVEVK